MQDIELTIERGKLYILQTRNGKRTAQADLKIAHDMVGEGLIDKKEALLRIDPAVSYTHLSPLFMSVKRRTGMRSSSLRCGPS